MSLQWRMGLSYMVGMATGIIDHWIPWLIGLALMLWLMLPDDTEEPS